MLRLLAVAFCLAACALAVQAEITPAVAQEKTTVKLSLNPVIYAYLPIYLAIDKGYFAAKNIDVAVTRYSSSAVTQMPVVARGDVDITPQVAGPALFNQQGEGFDIKIIASIQEPHPGWADGEWVMVRRDLWDDGTIRSLKDLKGHAVDGGPDGSPISFIMNEALTKAGLTRSDVKYTARLGTPADWIAAFTNKAADVLTAVEPVATVLESRGLAKKLASNQDIVPWMQESFLVSSASYIAAHPTVVRDFLEAYLKGATEVTEAGGKWTPEFLTEVAKWSGLSQEDIAKVPGPAYVGQLGTVSVSSIAREQDYFATIGLVKNKIDPASLVVDAPLTTARKALNLP